MNNVEIASTVFRDIRDWILENPEVETGGVMLGQYDNVDTPSIIFVTPSGMNAHQGALSFQAEEAFIQGAVFAANHMTNGEIHYMGLWHSHPTGNPQPSPRDLDACMEMHEAAMAAESPAPLMLIAALGDGSLEFTAWGVVNHVVERFSIREFEKFELTITHELSFPARVEA